jgi:hypothetical protein
MHKSHLMGAAGVACLVLATWAVAGAMMIAPQPIPLRVATAECVVLGTVTGIEDKLVKASRFVNDQEKGEYKIAVVKIAEGFGSAKGLTHIRVGFQPPPPPGDAGAPPGPRIRPGRIQPVQLHKDQEVLLFLSPNIDGTFHIAPAYFDVIVKNKENAQQFTKDLAEAKRSAKLLADPKAGLESKNADERFLTAAMLLTRFRTQKVFDGQPPKQEPIDAEQSKEILLALAGADWGKNPPPGGFMLNPQAVFFRLNLTEKDGWKQPKNFQQTPQAAKAWLKDNAEKYRIQRFVEPEKKADK